MAARSTWRGAIDFGGFPIHLSAYNLVRSKSADSLKTLCPCHQEPIAAPKTCATTGEVVIAEDCLKGVEVSRGDIRLLPEEAVDALRESESSKTLQIAQLPPKASVPLHMALGHYRLVPDEKVPGSEGPAGILWNGLMAAERALVTEIVTRAGSRNALLSIHADVHGLNGTTLPYSTDFNDVPEHAFEINEQAGAMFDAFVAQQGIDLGEFTLSAYVDSYRERRNEAIQAALAGEPIPANKPSESKPAVPDLMAAMAAALDAAPAATKKPRKAAAKPKAKAPA